MRFDTLSPETRAAVERLSIQLKETQDTLRPVFPAINESAERYSEIGRQIRESLESLSAPYKAFQERINALVAPFAYLNAAKAAMEPTGILPHTTTPWDRFDASESELFSARVEEYFRNEWDAVSRELGAMIDSYEISDETNASMAEAIECHGHGLYRSTVRSVYPAIESEFRSSFSIEVGKQDASLRMLRKTLKEAPVTAILAHVAPIRLFNILDTHIYDPVKTLEALDRFTKDPVPNRHAVVHGVINYTTWVHSLNSLIVADYIFMVIDSLKRLQEDQDQAPVG